MSDRKVGHALRVAAVDAGLTQEQLAERVGLSRRTVSLHMRGVTLPDVDQLERYADALGVAFVIGPTKAPAVGVEPTTYRLTDPRAAA